MDHARLDRTVQILDNPNADMRSQMDFTKYGPYQTEAGQLKSMLDRDNIMSLPVGFEQRDIYDHYRTSNYGAVDPYEIDRNTIIQMKYQVLVTKVLERKHILTLQSLRTKEDWEKYREASEAVVKDYGETNTQLNHFIPVKQSLFQRAKEMLPLAFNEDKDAFGSLISGERPLATIAEDFDEWSIYLLAHKVYINIF